MKKVLFLILLLFAARASAQVPTGGGSGLPVGCSNGQVPVWQTSTLRWICGAGSSSGAAGGSDTQVQFNDSTSLAGDAGMTYNKTTDALTLVGPFNKITFTPPSSSATLTLANGSSLITSGAFAVTFTATATTNVTLPTSGNIPSTSGSWVDTDFVCSSGTTGKAFIDCGAKLTDFPTITGVAADDTLLVGTGTNYAIKALTNCPSSGITYTAATNTFGCSGAGGGNVTTGGTLALNSVVLGGGVTDVETSAGFTTDGVSILTLGVAGSSVGTVAFKNATSGTINLLPVAGALSTRTLSLPAVTDTIATLANSTFTGGTIPLPEKIVFLAGACSNATAGLGLSTPTTLGAQATCQSGAAGGHPAFGTANFINTEVDEVHGHFPLPSDWTGNIDVTLKWMAVSTTANDVVWQVKFGCTATNEAASVVSYNTTAFAAVTNLTTTLRWNVSTKTSITTTGCAAGEEAQFIIFRDTSAAGDTLDADVQLINASFTVRRSITIGG